MIRYSGRFKRTAALLMAVWFMASIGLVHSFHNHSRYPSAGSGSNPTTAVHNCSAPISDPGSTRLVDDVLPKLNRTSTFAYCVACLLVNTCNAGSVEWTFEPQNHANNDLGFRSAETAYFFPDLALQPSRAPPVSIS